MNLAEAVLKREQDLVRVGSVAGRQDYLMVEIRAELLDPVCPANHKGLVALVV